MPGEQSPTSRRTYNSTLRQQQSSQTRESILEAAQQLFGQHGFAATTIAAIAAQAKVSVQTVYATFGTKARLVQAILGQMQESAQAADWRAKIAAEHEPGRILAAFAHWTCAFFVASRPAMTIANEAGPELAALFVQGNEQRRRALTSLVDRIDAVKALRPDLSAAKAVDRAWLVTGIDTFINATQGCGWTPQEYTAWLTEMLAQQLLQPGQA